jgi:hypothetical protein
VRALGPPSPALLGALRAHLEPSPGPLENEPCYRPLLPLRQGGERAPVPPLRRAGVEPFRLAQSLGRVGSVDAHDDVTHTEERAVAAGRDDHAILHPSETDRGRVRFRELLVRDVTVAVLESRDEQPERVEEVARALVG